MNIVLKLALVIGLILSSVLPLSTKALASDESKIIITEIKLGGGNDPKEFVTLYNQTFIDVSLSGWKLEYVKSNFDSQFCTLSSWADNSGSITALSGTISAGGVISVTRSLNDNAAGSLRIIDPDLLVHDLVGWGTEAKCYDTSPSSVPSNGKSLQRYIDCEMNIPIDNDNNVADFILSSSPSPGILNGLLTDDCNSEEEPPGGGLGGDPEQPLNSCEGIIISELLPNPSGTDTGKEFVELHNPTQDIISLEDCTISVSSSAKIFLIGDTKLEAGQYLAFYDTGLTLPNSAGGSVFLLDVNGTEISQVNYPPGLGDDVSWSLLEGAWRETFSPSPNSPNFILSEKPCPVGQSRNLETGRCSGIALQATGLTACKPGQERNLETNRCRNIASLASALRACEPGQTRNPSTNRCRKADSSSLVPCKENQERNPETNRCRNLTGASTDSITDVKDVLAATSTDKSGWFLAGASMFLALGYAMWEWRNELIQQLLAFKNRFSF